jgi:hypothetical protein
MADGIKTRKPRIKRWLGLVWVCEGEGYTGSGKTPELAYHSWVFHKKGKGAKHDARKRK